jgi:hypothetical protein
MKLEPGSLRIGKAIPTGEAHRAGMELEAVSPATAPPPEKPYLARLVLLVPAEVISLYVAMKPVAKDFLPSFGLVCLLLVLMVRMKATWADGGPEWGSVGISAVSFGLWIYSTGGSLPWLPAPKDAGVIAVAIAVWTFVVPFFYQGEKTTTG